MEWFRTHPYATAIAVSSGLLIAGILIVGRSTPVSPSGLIAWSGTGAIPYQNSQGGNGAGEDQRPTLMQEVQGNAPYTYIPTSNRPAIEGVGGSDSFDFDAFISLLSTPSSAAAPSASGEAETSISYSFIPTGLVSTSASTPTRTPVQEALHEYGNNIGAFVQAFETEHTNSVQLLTDQASDRNNPEKAGKVLTLAGDFESLGKTLQAMDDVPPQAASAHEKLAQSYIALGQKLALVPGAVRDSDFIAAVNAYNAAADAFVKRYVALVELFGSYGVRFSAGEPGSAFAFSPIGNF